LDEYLSLDGYALPTSSANCRSSGTGASA